MLRTNSIPIILLTGFLGAGKTSLLNNLLQNKQSFKIGVIINDFGQINVDAMLVAAQTDSTLELSNGCICCSLDGLNGDLDNALDQLAHRGSRLDYILIEASGLAEVKELVTMLKMVKSNYCHFDLLLNVVDGSNFEKNNKSNPHAVEDLAISDIIILNKVDLLSSSQLQDIKKAINFAAPKSRLVETSHGQMDYRLVLGASENQGPSRQVSLSDHHDHSHGDHLHTKFSSLTFQTEKPLDPAEFEAWAKKIPLNVFRAKGVVFFGMKGVGQKFIFQAVGQRHSLKLDEWTFDQKPQTQLVVIGTDLDEKKILAELDALIDTQPDNVSKDTLMDIFMYK